ncbi:hypothetical protein D3C87_1346630 [compost metagenome]
MKILNFIKNIINGKPKAGQYSYVFDFPGLKKGESALSRVDRNTGIVLNENFKYAGFDNTSVYTKFGNIEEAINTAREIAKANTTVEIYVYDNQQELVYFIDVEKEKFYKPDLELNLLTDMDIKALIPKNKFDEEVIDGLKALSFDQLKPIIPELLEWLQDMNWPIARPIADILEPHVDRMVPELIKIFKTNDGMWKLWILINLARHTKDPLLLSEIARIAKFPTKDEVEDEVHLEATAILNGDYIT